MPTEPKAEDRIILVRNMTGSTLECVACGCSIPPFHFYEGTTRLDGTHVAVCRTCACTTPS